MKCKLNLRKVALKHLLEHLVRVQRLEGFRPWLCFLFNMRGEDEERWRDLRSTEAENLALNTPTRACTIQGGTPECLPRQGRRHRAETLLAQQLRLWEGGGFE